MLAIFRTPAYDFIGWRRVAYGVSVAVMLLGLGSILAKGGLRYDIDFTGGTLVELRLAQPLSVGTIRSRLTAAGLGESVIQVFGDPRDVLIRTQVGNADAAELSRRVADALAGHGTGAADIRRAEFVGPQIGQELRRQALYAVLAALGGILVYIWIRFDFRGGAVTIVSLAHDVLICLGALSLANFEFSLPVLAALLTVIGFSFATAACMAVLVLWRASRRGSIPSEAPVGYMLLFALCIVVLLTTAWFGGELVYGHGIGVGLYAP